MARKPVAVSRRELIDQLVADATPTEAIRKAWITQTKRHNQLYAALALEVLTKGEVALPPELLHDNLLIGSAQAIGRIAAVDVRIQEREDHYYLMRGKNCKTDKGVAGPQVLYIGRSE